MLRYLGSMLILFLAFAYFGKRTRPWTAVRAVMTSFSLLRLSLLVALLALSPDSTQYPPCELSFSSTAVADVYMLLLYAAMTVNVRRRISTVIMPVYCVPIIRAELTCLSQANKVKSPAGDHLSERASGGSAPSPQTGADANTPASTSPDSSSDGTLNDDSLFLISMAVCRLLAVPLE